MRKSAIVLITVLFATIWLLASIGTSRLAAQTATCTWPEGWHLTSAPSDPRETEREVARNSVLSLAADWSSPNRLYAGALWGMYQTEDCGQSWSLQFGHEPAVYSAVDARAVATHPSRGVYVAGTPSYTLFVRGYDVKRWAAVTDASGYPVLTVDRAGIIVAPTGRLYISTSTSPGTFNPARRLFYTDDGGVSWTTVRQDSGFRSMVVDPFTPAILYAVDFLQTNAPRPMATPGVPPDRLVQAPPYRLHRSTDSGATFQPWSQVEELPGAIAVSADGSRFWFASYGQHLWQSRDQGQSWQILDTMPFTDPKQLAVSPHDPRVLYAVSGDGNIWVYREPDTTPGQEVAPEGRAACSRSMPWLQVPILPIAC